MEWRVVRKRRRIGKLYWLQYGYYGVRDDWRYGALKPHWITQYEEDYDTLDAARAALKIREEQSKPKL